MIRAGLAAWRAMGTGVLEFLLPAACAICHRPNLPDNGSDSIVCSLCMGRLTPLALPLCERCGHPRLSVSISSPAPRSVGETPPALPSAEALPPCRWCVRLHPCIRAVRSVCRMDEGTGAELVHALKYHGWRDVAVPMARRMNRLQWPQDVSEERAAIVPVPLSPERERERGYNQAEALARALTAHWDVPVWTDVLRRVRNTRSQVALTPSQRTGNVSGAFAVSPGRHGMLAGQHVVIVDDVITTAATLNASAQALFEGGVRIISCVTFGRAPDPGDRAASVDD